MTVEKLERGQQLLKNIKDYEEKIECVEHGDIFREIILAQLKKDLNFLKERFESL